MSESEKKKRGLYRKNREKWIFGVMDLEMLKRGATSTPTVSVAVMGALSPSPVTVTVFTNLFSDSVKR